MIRGQTLCPDLWLQSAPDAVELEAVEGLANMYAVHTMSADGAGPKDRQGGGEREDVSLNPLLHTSSSCYPLQYGTDHCRLRDAVTTVELFLHHSADWLDSPYVLPQPLCQNQSDGRLYLVEDILRKQVLLYMVKYY